MNFKLFKHGLSLVLAVLLPLSLAGCNRKKPAPEPVTLSVWHYYNGPQQQAFDALVSEFNETLGAEQKITVTPTGMGNIDQLTQSVLDAANKKVGAPELPNIFAAYSDTAFEVNQMGLVASLDAYLTPAELDTYLPGYLEEGRFDADGSLKIFPIAKSTEIMLVNKTDWDKFAEATGATADALATMEGITATAKAYYQWSDSLTPAKGDGKAFFGRDSMANYLLIGCRQQGVTLLEAEGGQVALNLDPIALRRLWDNFYLPYLNGYFAHLGRFRSDDIKTGGIVALVGSTTSASYFPRQVINPDNSAYDIEMMVLEAPLLEGGQQVAVQQGAGMVVTKASPRAEQASVEFLKWFTQKEQNLRFSLESGYLPVTKEGATPGALKDFLAANPTTKLSADMTAVLATAFATSTTRQMYANKAFLGANDARNVLESSLTDRAIDDRKKLKAMLASGVTQEAALAEFDTDANFEDWLSELRYALERAVTSRNG